MDSLIIHDKKMVLHSISHQNNDLRYPWSFRFFEQRCRNDESSEKVSWKFLFQPRVYLRCDIRVSSIVIKVIQLFIDTLLRLHRVHETKDLLSASRKLNEGNSTLILTQGHFRDEIPQEINFLKLFQ